MFLAKESLYGNSKAKFILIRDNSAFLGVRLLKSISKLFSKENVNHHFIYYENIHQDLHEGLKFNNFTVTDAVSEPCGWNLLSSSFKNQRSAEFFEKKVSGYKGVVYIDSLSPLLFYNDINQVYKTIYKILTDHPDLHIVAVLHDFAHSQYEIDLLEKLATSLFRFTSEDQLSVTVRYSSGKVKKYSAECVISKDYSLSTFREIDSALQFEPTIKPDPTANLTFNLKLRSQEIEARNQLVLPYTQMQKFDTVEMEDVYDEDPDDDLDI